MTHSTLHIGIELECIRKYKQSALYYFGEEYNEFKPYFNYEGGQFSNPREWIHDPNGQLGPLNLEKLRTMFVDFIGQHNAHIQANAPAKQSIDIVTQYVDDPGVQISIVTKADDPASLIPSMQWLQSRNIPFNNVLCFSNVYPSEHIFFDIFIYPSTTEQPDFIEDMTGVTIGFDKQTSFEGLSNAIRHIRNEKNDMSDKSINDKRPESPKDVTISLNADKQPEENANEDDVVFGETTEEYTGSNQTETTEDEKDSPKDEK